MTATKKQLTKSAAKPKVEVKTKVNTRLRLVLFSSLAVLFLLIANSALWVNRVVFNTENFSEITTNSLLSESSRGAVANEIVERSLSGRPIVKNLVQEPATKFISGLLATSQAEAGVKKVSSRLQIALTSNNSQDIEIDLGGVKQTAAKLIDLAGRQDQLASESTNVSQIPDKITLLEVSKLPKFYKLGTLFMWLAPLALVAGLSILAIPHIRARRVQLEVLFTQGVVVLCGWIVGLLMGPLFRPPVLSQFSNINLRIVAENLYNSFVTSFNSQLQLILILGLVMVAIPSIQRIYSLLKRSK